MNKQTAFHRQRRETMRREIQFEGIDCYPMAHFIRMLTFFFDILLFSSVILVFAISDTAAPNSINITKWIANHLSLWTLVHCVGNSGSGAFAFYLINILLENCFSAMLNQKCTFFAIWRASSKRQRANKKKKCERQTMKWITDDGLINQIFLLEPQSWTVDKQFDSLFICSFFCR